MAMKTIVFKVSRSETTYALHVTSVILYVILECVCVNLYHTNSLEVESNPDWLQPIRVSKLQ